MSVEGKCIECDVQGCVSCADGNQSHCIKCAESDKDLILEDGKCICHHYNYTTRYIGLFNQ